MASSSSAMEAQIRSEIERLTATINQHKALQKQQSAWDKSTNYYTPYHGGGHSRNTYVNPNYQSSNKYIRPGLKTAGPSTTTVSSPSPATPLASSGPPVATAMSQPPPVIPGQIKEVVLGGVAFESSGRSLVRKDLPKSSKAAQVTSSRPTANRQFLRKPGQLPPGRAFRVKARRGRNMTLNNTKRPYQSRKMSKRKYIDKPCPRFTTTGACSRGLTCLYQHDPAKIAICWNFLQDNCSKTAETCNLSHDPIPQRTPLCFHFLNKGRCTRERCPFPHVNVGQRHGVCRDFAVLGYCERGLECDHQHVRECPDFAEKGTCETKGCKLPHVIRANRNRKVADNATGSEMTEAKKATGDKVAEDGQLGDDYISLTFRESDSEEGSEEEDAEEEEEEEMDDAEDDDMSDILEVHT